MSEKINIEDLEPRSLQTKDLFRVATILNKCGDKLMEVVRKSDIDLGKLGEKVKEMKEGDVKDSQNVQVFGVQIFSVVFAVAESDIKPFLADLVGMKVEEFDITPYQTSLVIIEKLAKKENLLDFFQRASKLAEIFKPLEKKQTS